MTPARFGGGFLFCAKVIALQGAMTYNEVTETKHGRGNKMNALERIIEEMQKEHDEMWKVARESKEKGLATIEGQKGLRLTKDNLIDWRYE